MTEQSALGGTSVGGLHTPTVLDYASPSLTAPNAYKLYPPVRRVQILRLLTARVDGGLGPETYFTQNKVGGNFIIGKGVLILYDTFRQTTPAKCIF